MEPIPVMRESFSEVQDSARIFILKVYMWMTAGLLITAVVSIAPFLLFTESQFMNLIADYIYVFYGLMIFELLIVCWSFFSIHS